MGTGYRHDGPISVHALTSLPQSPRMPVIIQLYHGWLAQIVIAIKAVPSGQNGNRVHIDDGPRAVFPVVPKRAFDASARHATRRATRDARQSKG